MTRTLTAGVKVAVLIVVFVVFVVFGATRLSAALRATQAAIAAARADADRYRNQRDSLVSVVRRREQEQAALTVRLEQYRRGANSQRDSVTALERRRSNSQLAVRRLRTTGALVDRLRLTFPELGDSSWRLATLPAGDGDTLGLEALVVPAWFAETFIIDHENAASWQAQKDRLLAVDSLRLRVAALQDSILRLETANAAEYERGYRAAYGAYEDQHRRYVAELAKPRFELPSPLGLLGAAAVGLVVGRALR
jgi:Sec-independent protein translocase protein TatA/uncharacterized small protein (DUF1192 family)